MSNLNSCHLEPKQQKPIACSYRNKTSRPQIVRITNTEYFLERVVYPEQKISFKASTNSYLEIYSSEIITSILEDRILCTKLTNTLD